MVLVDLERVIWFNLEENAGKTKSTLASRVADYNEGSSFSLENNSEVNVWTLLLICFILELLATVNLTMELFTVH
jgi:hypothetical protein